MRPVITCRVIKYPDMILKSSEPALQEFVPL